MSDQLPSNKNEPPFHDSFQHFMKQMDRLFVERRGRNIMQSIDEFFTHSKPFGGFPTELKETKEEYVIIAQLPGVKKNLIDIEVLQNYVTITVQKHQSVTKQDQNKASIQHSSMWNQQTRTIPLSKPIEHEKVRASYKDGLLTIKIKKKKGKQVDIE